MKKSYFLLVALLAGGMMNAKTLRVNNDTGAQAPYTTVASALQDAEDGDVIILDGTPYDYGDFTVNKAVTIQGNGYYLAANGIGAEGASPVSVGLITVETEGAKICSLSANEIRLNRSHNVVTRCWLRHLTIGTSSMQVSDCIIHQNFFAGSGIRGVGVYISGKNVFPSQLQITNNIFIGGDPANRRIYYIDDSVLKYNTFTVSPGNNSLLDAVSNSVIEYNVNGGVTNAGSTNSYAGNIDIDRTLTSDDTSTDKSLKEAVASLSGDAGAFAGDDPYVLAGVAPGPRIDDLVVPASVEQGQNLNVTVKIGRSK